MLKIKSKTSPQTKKEDRDSSSPAGDEESLLKALDEAEAEPEEEADASGLEFNEDDFEEDAEAEASPSSKINPKMVVYMGPEQGPFKCGNCRYFNHGTSSACSVVDGSVDEEGCCNVFSSAGGTPVPPAEEEEVY